MNTPRNNLTCISLLFQKTRVKISFGVCVAKSNIQTIINFAGPVLKGTELRVRLFVLLYKEYKFKRSVKSKLQISGNSAQGK